MAESPSNNRRPRVVHGLASIGNRAASVTIKPLTGAVGAATGAGISLERRAIDRFLESGELERILASRRLHAAFQQVLESDGAQRLIDDFFDSGLFDYLLERLLESDGLWHIIDVVAASPAVTAAISQQGLGFADQVGQQVRTRSRKADDRLERLAHRIARRPPPEQAGAPDPGGR